MEYEIRKAQVKDVEKIQELSQKLIEYEYKICKHKYQLDLNWSTSEDAKNTFLLFIEKYYLYVALINNEIIGYMSCMEGYDYPCLNDKSIELVNLFVLKEYRNLGIGREFIKIVKQLCIDNNIKFFKLSTLCDNEIAINFYKKMELYNYDVTMMYEIDNSKKLCLNNCNY